MKKSLKRPLILLIICAVAIFAYWTISPFFRTEEVSEALPAMMTQGETVETVSGIFTGFDRVHNGEGTATLILIDGKYILRFEEDFKVTNGPDLYVGFGQDGEYIKGSEISRLKGNVGSQNYELPATFNPEEYTEVWIWCKAFSQPFARAVLVR